MRHITFSILVSALLVLPLSAASVDGLRLHSTSSGSGKKTVIFVHGWTCDETSWTSQVPALSRQYRVVTLDLPGHGKSESPKDGKFSMDLFARAVEAVRAEAKADKVVLVGHSMGTPVIRQYARLYPQHVAGLVLVDGLLTIPGGGPARGAAPQPARMGGPGGLQAREKMIRGMFTPATPPAVQEQVLKMMLAPPEATATGAMLATFDAANWRDDVMSVPVLGIYADKSQFGNQEYARKVFTSFDYVEIPGTGHFLMMEKPEEFNRLLTRFLEKVNDGDSIKSLLTQPSMNVFRRFTVDRAKMLEFYGEVLALRPMPAINMPGGGQMSRFQVGTSEIKLTTTRPDSREKSGAVKEVTGLRVFTFFFPDEAALTARFKAHAYPAPEFQSATGGPARVAMVQDPDAQWVEPIVVPGAPAATFDRLEVGLTVSDLEESRAFYREFIGLEELKPVDGGWLGTTKYPYRHGTTTVNLWSFGKGLPANTNTAGIQYVGRNVEAVDARAKQWDVKITQPLGNFSAALRTIWLADPIRTASRTISRR